jgi:aspartate aminotransferase-like enzyme
LAARGIKSVAADGFGAPGVVVCYTGEDDIKTGKTFADLGLQIAAGVPLQCDEGPDFKTFRLGLFGLDKLQNIERTVATLARSLERIATF